MQLVNSVELEKFEGLLSLFAQTEVFLIRHAQTKGNVKSLASGWNNDRLTSIGVAQAVEAGRILSQWSPFNAVYHSELTRSRLTAIRVNSEIGSNLVREPGLNEQNFGEWEGLPWIEVLDRLRRGETPPGGESRAGFIERNLVALNRILVLERSNRIILVVHGGIFFALAQLLGKVNRDVRNCEIIRASTNGASLCDWKSLNNFNEKVFY